MSPAVRLVFVLHDHQPVGNFDGVIEQAYHDSYLPFLELLERHPGIRLALHTSGPLAEWFDRHHPDYLDRVARLVAERQIEIVGGAFYEPVLAMLPARDRIGQIRMSTEWLERRFQTKVTGMWVAERVWDPGMTRDIAAAGIEWTILDDSHFKAAGLPDEQLDRHWLTEGDGATLAVFPVSEHLRYVIPFAAPEASIDHLRFLATRRPGALAVFGDDGEKFGVWPDTRKACFDDGWLETFFGLLEANADWIQMCLPSEVVREVPPAGTVWLPECSYREMMEWVLPPDSQLASIEARKTCASDPRLASVARFLRGGSWRNFRMRYPEANEMYARMMAVSRRLERLAAAQPAMPGMSAMPTMSGPAATALAEATQALYRGQCNCAYWHGAFGGIYLPHLRNAIYHELIAADAAADRAEGRRTPWVEATTDDFDFDGRTEVRLSSDGLDAWIAPARGGMLYELGLRDLEHKLLATLDMPGSDSYYTGLQVVGSTFSLNGTSVPAGSLLVFNGYNNPDAVFAINATTGAVIASLNFAQNYDAASGTFDTASGRMFLLESSPDQVVEVNPTTGAQISIFTLPFDVYNGGIAVNPLNGNLVIVTSQDNKIYEYTKAGVQVRTVSLASLNIDNELTGIAVDSTGLAYLSSNRGVVYRVQL